MLRHLVNLKWLRKCHKGGMIMEWYYWVVPLIMVTIIAMGVYAVWTIITDYREYEKYAHIYDELVRGNDKENELPWTDEELIDLRKKIDMHMEAE